MGSRARGRPRITEPTVTLRGYVYVTAPNGDRVLEHRLIAENIIGRQLTSYERIIHKDGNKANNDPENLIVAVTTLTPLMDYESRRY